MKKVYCIAIALLLILCPTLYSVGYYRGRRAIVLPEPDTTVVVHQKVSYKPQEVAKIRVGSVSVPSVIVQEGKTDTIFVEVPREQSHFHEDGLYDCWVSGAQVEMDSIKVKSRTQYITKRVPVMEEPKPNKIFIRGQLAYDGRMIAPITVNYGYEMRYITFWGGAGFDPILKSPVAQVGVDIKFSWR